MATPRRLFDCLDLLQKQHPSLNLLAGKEEGVWKHLTVTEVVDAVEKLSAGLLALGISSNDMSVENRDKIAIISKNRPEWVLLDLAVQKIGAILVPIYPTVHVNDLEFVLNDAAVKMVFVNDQDLLDKLQIVLPNTPTVKHVYSFEKLAGCQYWRDILPLGQQEHYQQVPVAAARINTEDLFTIIYTSGTTGTPKGVMLSHHNVLSNVLTIMPEFNLSAGTRVISFLPLNHIFERTVTFFYLYVGASIHYAESLDALGDNIREVKPEMFTTVPRLLEKVYEKIMSKGDELTGAKRKLFFWAVGLAQQYDIKGPKSFTYKMQLAIANALIFKKWREALGGSIRFIVTGAAACQVKLIRIFTAAGIPILEGYGLTETSPVISFNRVEETARYFGTVGPAIAGVDVKIAEDGEILTRGPNVMMGYYKRPDLTAEVIKDGWFYTGDIGTLVEGRFLKITDRKKEIFKTSGGKFVAPLPIESKMAESPFIEQIMVVGAGQKFAGALIVPSFKNLRDWGTENGVDTTLGIEALLAHEKIKAHMKKVVEAINQNFSNIEQIKKFELLPQEWSIEGNELTPKLSLRRKVICDKYQAAIDRIFA